MSESSHSRTSGEIEADNQTAEQDQVFILKIYSDRACVSLAYIV